MPTAEMSLIGQMDDYILDGKFHDATDTFCRLAVSGYDVSELMTHAMQTAAPYLHVPSHQKLLPNGEFRNVNYDHTILGFRAGMRLMPYLSARRPKRVCCWHWRRTINPVWRFKTTGIPWACVIR